MSAEPAPPVPAAATGLPRERVVELERELLAQRVLVDLLDEATADERARLARLDREWSGLREQVPAPRDPGDEWQRAEGDGALLLLRLDRGVTVRVVIDVPSGAIWFAPLGTRNPDGDGWLLGYLTAGSPVALT